MSGGKGSLVRRYVDLLDGKLKWFVLLVWFGLTVGGVMVMKKFIGNTSGTINPPPGTPAYISNAQSKTYFENNSQTAALIVLFEATGENNFVTLPPNTPPSRFCNSTAHNATAPCVINDFIHTLYTRFSSPPDDYHDFFVPNVKTAFSVNYYGLTELGCMMNNYSIGAVKVSQLITNNTLLDEADKIVSADKQHTMLVISYNNTKFAQGNAFAKALLDHVGGGKLDLGAGVSATPTGQQVFGYDIIQGAKKDISNMDLISVPVGLCILCAVLRAPRLVIIPFVNIFASLLGSFLFMYPVSMCINVISFAPSEFFVVVVFL